MRWLRKTPWILFGGFLFFYFCLFLVRPCLGPIDDHVLLNTLQVGKRLHFFIVPQEGRFYPLDAQEYNLVSLIAPAPLLYYLFNACQFLALIFLFFSILKKLAPRSRLVLPSLVYLALLPGFTAAFFRLQVPERDSLFFFSLFLLFYLRHLERPRYLDLFCGLLSANVALYYKEPGFLMLGAFAFLHFLTEKEAALRQKAFDLLLLLSSLIFAGIYYWVAFRHIGAHRYGTTSFPPLFLTLKNLLFFALSDPLVTLLLPFFLGFRFLRMKQGKTRFHPVHDSLLIGSLLYFLAYLALKIQTYHYLLPIYAFLLPSLLYFFRFYRPWRMEKAAIALLSMLFLNSSLIGLHSLSNTKYIPHNYNLMLNQLVRDLPPEGKTSIFLDGVNPASGNEMYQSLGRFLNFHGIGNERFDLKSDLPPDNLVFAKRDPDSPYAVFKGAIDRVKRGDYLIVTPHTGKDSGPEYLEALGRDYDLLYRTRSPFAFPDLSLKSALKELALVSMRQFKMDATLGHLVNENRLHRPDYYLYRKR
ncbi:MAG TPA: hypothetical protein DD435_04445 [Cyanobacteria bacterium UBA8530]|nr:hypothetical protein [Cyanobacteria bacterium UBA8530]